MLLYHGSSIASINTLEPRPSNHDKPYVYLTHSPVLAAIYAHNVLPSPYGWFTYFWSEGHLYYEEYFPHQLEIFYQGKPGYIYTCEAALPTLDKMPWVYLSETPVPTAACRFIPNLYEELLALEEQGQLIIRRYHTLSPKNLDRIRRIVTQQIDQYQLRDHPDSPYAVFLRTYFPDLL